MITPMQEVFAQLRASKDSNGFGEAYCVDWLLEMEKEILEKEKEVMCYFAKKWDMELGDVKIRSAESCFDETFKTKER